MKMKKYALILLTISFIFICCKANKYDNPKQMVLPVETDKISRLSYVKLNIEGNMYDFILDFSSSQSLISRDTANRITNSNYYKKNILKIDSLNCGIYEFNKVEFFIDDTLVGNSDFDGFLCSDFFKKYNLITLDMATNRIIINDIISTESMISYRESDNALMFNIKNRTIGLVFGMFPNMFADHIQFLQDVDLTINSPIYFEEYEKYAQYKELFIKYDVLLGFDTFIGNTVTFDFKNQKLAFNKSINTTQLPLRKCNEKISYCESVEINEYKLPTVVNIPFYISNKGIQIQALINKTPFQFVLDTGCHDNILFKNGVQKELKKVNEFERGFKFYFSSFKISEGDFKYTGFKFFNNNLNKIELDGILGIEFLSKQSQYNYVQINCIDNILIFSNVKPNNIPHKIELHNNNIFCEVEINKKNYKALIDSGNLSYSIIIDQTEDLFTEKKQVPIISLYNESNHTYPYSKGIKIKLDNEIISLPLICMTDKEYTQIVQDAFSEEFGGKYNLLLGLDFFKQRIITFDFENSLMWVE